MSQVDALPLIAELLERIAFLMPTGVDPEPPTTWAIVAEVIWHRVDGHGQGSIQVALDANAASAAATNMLGLDPAIPPAAGDLLDAGKEMANVLAGNLLPALYGDTEYRLDSPVLVSGGTLASTPTTALQLVEGRFAIAVRAELTPASPARKNLPMRILVAEDDSVSRSIIHHHLAKIGDCDVTTNGQEAVAAFTRAWQEGRPYSLGCLDIMMPVMDGQEALRRIRRLEQERGIHGSSAIKIIMTTAMDDPRTIMTAFRAQCEAYLVKPINEALLLEHLVAFGMVAGK